MKLNFGGLLTVLLLCLLTKVQFVCPSILTPDGLIPADYDHFAHPGVATKEKTLVTWDIDIKSLSWTTSGCDVIVKTRQRWRDARLALHNSLPTTRFRRNLLKEKIWTPLPLFEYQEAKQLNEGHLIWNNNGAMEQVLEYRTSGHFTTFSQKDVSKIATCAFKIGDVVYGDQDLTLEWSKEGGKPENQACAKLNSISHFKITAINCIYYKNPEDDRVKLSFEATYEQP